MSQRSQSDASMVSSGSQSTTFALELALGVALAAAAFFGGASRLHEVRLALVELAALPLLVVCLLLALQGRARLTPLATGVLVATAALPLLQLVPLPPAIWSMLPGRDQNLLALELAGMRAGWSPLSLTPDMTWRSFLALIPPVAAFLAIGMSSGTVRFNVVRAILVFTALSTLMGAAQFATGAEGLYLWPTTDRGNIVGFFANRNHLATLCLIAIPFAAVIGARTLRRRDGNRAVLWAALVFVLLLVAALAVIQSRMGAILLGPSLGGSALAAWIASGGRRPRPVTLAMIGAAVVALVALGAYAYGPLIERFDTTPASEGRFENWPIVSEAATKYLPIGSGLGSFDSVYRSVEPLDQLDPTFFNQAHNDYLETWLEAGWLGAALILAFMTWLLRRAWLAWRASVSTESDLQRAASVAIGVVLAHSLVDYPLRTATIAVVFALCCGFLEAAARLDLGSRRSPRPARG